MTTGSVPVKSETLSCPVNSLVARVIITSVRQAHLDHPFDYLVPPELEKKIQLGQRVKVKFGRQQADGIVVEIHEQTKVDRELNTVSKLVGSVPAATANQLQLAEIVANRYAGTRAEVYSFAIPVRVAKIENATLKHLGNSILNQELPAIKLPNWTADLDGFDELVTHLSITCENYIIQKSHNNTAKNSINPVSNPKRYVLSPPPGTDENTNLPRWTSIFSLITQQVLTSGKNVLILCPTLQNLEQMYQAIKINLGMIWPGGKKELEKHIAILDPESGNSKRYQAYLNALHGQCRILLGKRGAVLAPLRNLGLILIWDEANSAWNSPRSPYWHARDVAALRSVHNRSDLDYPDLKTYNYNLSNPNSQISNQIIEDCSATLGVNLVVAGFNQSLTAAGWVATNWAKYVGLKRPKRSLYLAHRQVIDEIDAQQEGPSGYSRLPGKAINFVKKHLQFGPVIVQVPLTGYIQKLRCSTCGEVASCNICNGPLGIPNHNSAPACSWCGALASFSCSNCKKGQFRATRVGSHWTRDEFGKLFPQVPVITSGARLAKQFISTVDSKPRLVIATPGAEPYAPQGYAGLLIVDAHISSQIPGLDASVQCLERWMNAAALVRSENVGGTVMVIGRPNLVLSQAFLLWNSLQFATRELKERIATDLPPAAHVVALEGEESQMLLLPALIDGLAEELGIKQISVLGPVPWQNQSRILVRASSIQKELLRQFARQLRSQLSLQKINVKVFLDPLELF